VHADAGSGSTSSATGGGSRGGNRSGSYHDDEDQVFDSRDRTPEPFGNEDDDGGAPKASAYARVRNDTPSKPATSSYVDQVTEYKKKREREREA
jgi:hypothetical protein